jgi:hypothetical protein
VTVFSGVPAVLVLALLAAPQAGPETFDVIAKATPKGGETAASGAITVPLTIQIDRYTPEHDRTTMTDGLKYNGYPGFLRALRDAPRPARSPWRARSSRFAGRARCRTRKAARSRS